jgi:hypothetical protein
MRCMRLSRKIGLGFERCATARNALGRRLASSPPRLLVHTSSIRHGLTNCSGQPNSVESCASMRPIEIRGSQLIGLGRITRQRGQKHSMCV